MTDSVLYHSFEFGAGGRNQAFARPATTQWPPIWRTQAASLSAYMAIQKQEFYEGAALHQLIRGCGGAKIVFVAPFFELNDRIRVHLKYSTGVRSPWGFTFMPEEQRLLASEAGGLPIVIGLVCGSDGVAAIPSELFLSIARPRDVSVRVACARRHREHFEVSGPDGVAPGKIPPYNWQRLLSE